MILFMVNDYTETREENIGNEINANVALLMLEKLLKMIQAIFGD